MQHPLGTLTLSPVPLVPRAPAVPVVAQVAAPPLTAPQVIMRDGKPVTTSRAVAEFFGKEHKHVLRDIKALEIGPDLGQSFFADSTAPDGYGRPQPVVEVQAPAVVPVSPASPMSSFMFEGAAVRVTDLAGNPWFVLADVCKVLEIGNPSMAATRLDGDEKGVIIVDTLGGPQKTAIINESGLYCLVMTSRKPEAKRSKRWVTGEVLPAIRKTGGYGNQAPAVNLHDPNTLRTLLLAS